MMESGWISSLAIWSAPVKLQCILSESRSIWIKGIINDHGVIANMLSTLFESDSYTQMICKLQSFITEDIVIPYLKENGLIELRLPPVDPEDDDLDEEDEDGQ